MSRAERLINKHREAAAKQQDASGLVREQIAEEQELNDGQVVYVQSTVEDLEYMYEGEKHIIPCTTEDGKEMTYHDQYYQVTRLKNGLPIEAKRMIDYTFDVAGAVVEEGEPDTLSYDPEAEESEEYKAMKEAHLAQHPEED